jgi:mono/diheme cytochrome c family protein
MYNQPKAYGLRGSEFFEDSRSARPVVPGTVAVGEARTDDFFYTGLIDGQAVDQVPIEITAEVLEQGQQQYEIYCAPCHGISGYGNGMVARRGGTPPANYHSDYQLNQPISHYFVVATNGYRNMWSYEQKISAEDRWAIAVYIRALQVSQNAPETLVPEEELTRLQQPESNTQEEQGTDQ